MPSREWRDPLVRKLISGHRGRDPRELIEEHVQKLREETSQMKFPIDVGLIASFLGIKQRLGDYPFAGRIFAEPSGQLIMDLTTQDHLPRRRFTCGHEITHTAFPGFSRESRYRVDPSVGHHKQERNEEEFLCDLGAAELLLPRDLVAGEFSIGAGLKDVEQLAEVADASLEAAANKLTDLAKEPVGLLVLEMGYKPADRAELRKGKPVEKRLRVRYAKCNRLRTYIPRFKSVTDESLFGQALLSHSAVTGMGSIPGRDGNNYLIEAKRYDRGSTERVIAVVRPA